ncbi:nucleotidyltransferase domain-containing protein [Candidatus Woesearchaeota archaeon]|nr:nucleotidyltransferase domain-containing protein [Candidatus Woesearchaeota archaeon]
MPEQSELVAVALDFASFLLADSGIGKRINKIVLFGSVASGVFDDESDIDVFIDTDLPQAQITERFKLWTMSTRAEFWRAIGIRNELSLRIGTLAKWRDLHRSIISDGILLYGKYIEPPKGLRQHVLVSVSVPAMAASDSLKVWRHLYGYRQTVKGKMYITQGLVAGLGGMKIGRGILLMPAANAGKLFAYLRAARVRHTSRDVWTD